MNPRMNLRTLLVVIMIIGIGAACAPAAVTSPTAIPTAAKPAASTTQAPVAATAPAKATEKPAEKPAPTFAPASVKFGGTGNTAWSTVYVALEKGYFKEQGIDLELVNFNSSSEIVSPLATGQLEVGGLSLSLALLQAIDRGLDLKIVAPSSTSNTIPNAKTSSDYVWMMLRKDLADSGKVKTPADLKGMKIAIPSKGSHGDQTAQLMLEQAGLKAEDVEITVMPTSNVAVAFGNKGIDVAYATEPQVALNLQQGLATKWIPASSYFGGKTVTTILGYGPAILKNPDVARRFMVAYMKGARTYMKALTTGEGRDEVVNILIKHTQVKDAAIYNLMSLPSVDVNGVVDLENIRLQYQWLVDQGLYKGKKTFDDATDTSFAQYAVQQLGKQ